MSLDERSSRIGTVHFEALGARDGRRQADIVKNRANRENLAIELDSFARPISSANSHERIA